MPGKAIVLPLTIREIPGHSKEYSMFLNNRYMEYDKKYKSRIPRAPAFRRVSSRRVNRIVQRLSRGRTSQRLSERTAI